MRALRSAGNTGPIITFGGSYGGLLAMYSRMQYPNLVAVSEFIYNQILLFYKKT